MWAGAQPYFRYKAHLTNSWKSTRHTYAKEFDLPSPAFGQARHYPQLPLSPCLPMFPTSMTCHSTTPIPSHNTHLGQGSMHPQSGLYTPIYFARLPVSSIPILFSAHFRGRSPRTYTFEPSVDVAQALPTPVAPALASPSVPFDEDGS